MNPVFQFKQFAVHHDRCLMKVGTDGVLLGALADPGTARTILDIGTGCGVIALIMAQKSGAMVTGIDVDAESAQQAAENAAASPWPERLLMLHGPVQDYAEAHPASFDCIISNPPFFSNSLQSPRHARTHAKHTVDLSWDELMMAAARLLMPGGMAWFILPAAEGSTVLKVANGAGFSQISGIEIIPREGKPSHRWVLQFTKGVGVTSRNTQLVIRDHHGEYTEAYRKACDGLYLSLA
jgi:tRNA1Val (adenine37-N6)-methyltransferase